MAGTTFNTFTAGTPIRSSEMDANFDWLTRDIVPQLNGNTTDGAYDLGTSTAAWRRAYVQFINPTTTEAPLTIGTATSAQASSTVVEFAGPGAMIIPRVTTTQRDLFTTVNGMFIYNSTANQFQVFQNGAWNNMLGGQIGLVAKVRANTTSNVFTAFVDIGASGRLLSWIGVLGATGGSDLFVGLGLDSVTSAFALADGTSASMRTGNIIIDRRDTTTTFTREITNGSFAINSTLSLDIYFRSDLELQHRIDGISQTGTSYVLYERSA